MLREDDISSSSEQEVIDATVRFFLRNQNKSFKPGKKARRALHGKSLGTVTARFTVGELPAELSEGIFEHPGMYESVLRFSNGSLGPNAYDLLPNVRGVAIKIYNTDKPNVLAEEGIEQGKDSECDFLMVNSPTFFVRDIGFIEAIMHKNWARVSTYFPSILSNLIPATNRIVNSLLTENYYTQVPQWFGDRPCKYALIAKRKAVANGNLMDKNYLRHGLENDLQTAPTTFDFCVQFKQPEESMEILTQKWNGEMLTLASVQIEQRKVKIEESDGEELSFNPFRAPHAHQPAGWVGRMRKAVYKADFDWRKEKNG